MSEKIIMSEGVRAIIDAVYPVGKKEFFGDNDPNDLYPWQTWERYAEGRFLLSSSDTYAAGSTGGEATHTLTADEIPARVSSVEKAGYGLADSTYFRDRVLVGFSGGAHNNMPPYIADPCWIRTA